MAAHGITFAALFLALAALTHAAGTTHKDDARLFYDDSDNNTSLTIGGESLFFMGVIFVGLLLLTSFLGLFGASAKVAQPYDYAPATGYGASAPAYDYAPATAYDAPAPAPAYDEKTTFSVQQLIDDAINKFQ